MAVIHNGMPKEWPVLFRQRKLHVVCIASGGLTTCDFAASTIGGMRQEQEVWSLTKRVNHEGETGTFWPRFPLTVVPQLSWEDRSAPRDLEPFLRKSFWEVVKANRDYIKLPDVFLDLNPYGGHYDMEKALIIAQEILCHDNTISNLWIAPKGA